MGHLSRRKTHAYKPLSLRRRTWLTLGAVVLGGAGVVSYAVANPSGGPAADAARGKRPVAVHGLTPKNGGAGARELPRTGTDPFSLVGVSWTGAAAELDGTAQVRTRSSETGKWSGWQSLDVGFRPVDSAEPGAKDARGTSRPLWVGASDGIQARIAAADGSSRAGLPKGLQVNLVDPGVTAAEAVGAATGEGSAAGTNRASGTTGTVDTGTLDKAAFAENPTDPASASPAESAEPSAPASASASATASESAAAPATASASPTATPSPAPSPLASTVVQPPVVPRAKWGANESAVADAPEYTDGIDAVFVHHTGGTNDYSCAQSASLVRGLMAYDIQVGKRNDLGYNFLVDKCGRIFEGRAGGIDLPVRGEHTYGFNGRSTGVAVLGDFEGDAAATPVKPAGRPSRAAVEAVARLAAWKLGQYDGDPSGSVTLTADADTGKYAAGTRVTLRTVAGHKDVETTTSPGKNLYGKLAEIRRYASSAGRNSAAPTADYTGDGVSDLVAPTAKEGSGWLTLVPGGTGGPVAAAKRKLNQGSAGVPGAAESGDQWGAATAWGDINGDGVADLAVGAPGEDDTTHTDRGAVTILYGPAFDTGADTMALGDDYNPNSARFGATVAVGDFNADGKADVFTAATGTGGNWAARFGDGHEVAGDITTVSGALAYADAASGDFNRDGYADVALNYRDASGAGKVTWFKGSRTLGLSKVSTLTVKGGRSLAAGDVNGNGYDDIVVGQPYAGESGGSSGGQVTVVPGTSTGFTGTGLTTVHQSTSGVEGASESGDAFGTSVSVGDADADGYADVLTGAPNEDITRDGTNRSNAGSVWLLKGTSAGLTGTGSLAVSQDTEGVPGSTETDDKLGSALSLTDVTGDGYADLTVGAEGEDTGNGTLLYVPVPGGSAAPARSAYYGLPQLGTATAARLGQVLTP
ncbi:FG-GAP-like repeat-containing protein [Streptomyces sp. NPDC005551]|uniref:FG-GAP-like repeat-containing protein n=1 Tax=unclassified Streptomyces TaxID=2593676 RepID=UPI0033D13A57